MTANTFLISRVQDMEKELDRAAMPFPGFSSDFTLAGQLMHSDSNQTYKISSFHAV